MKTGYLVVALLLPFTFAIAVAVHALRRERDEQEHEQRDEQEQEQRDEQEQEQRRVPAQIFPLYEGCVAELSGDGKYVPVVRAVEVKVDDQGHFKVTDLPTTGVRITPEMAVEYQYNTASVALLAVYPDGSAEPQCKCGAPLVVKQVAVASSAEATPIQVVACASCPDPRAVANECPHRSVDIAYPDGYTKHYQPNADTFDYPLVVLAKA